MPISLTVDPVDADCSWGRPQTLSKHISLVARSSATAESACI